MNPSEVSPAMTAEVLGICDLSPTNGYMSAHAYDPEECINWRPYIEASRLPASPVADQNSNVCSKCGGSTFSSQYGFCTCLQKDGSLELRSSKAANEIIYILSSAKGYPNSLEKTIAICIEQNMKGIHR